MRDARLQALSAIQATGTILIARVDDGEEAYQICRAAVAGGIRAVEVPLTVPSALGVIERLTTEYQSQGVVIGAGTVLDAQAAYAAISAGAQLLVSPHLSRGMLDVALRYQVASMPGAMTPTEVVDATSAGADVVKLFPAEILGPVFVRAVLAPLPHVRLAPTGGVSPDNVADWFQAGVFSVGVGSYITRAARGTNDYRRVTSAAETFLQAVSRAMRATDSRISLSQVGVGELVAKE
jgi:2-dehydro-3-deoxyphosphogluconate aldolase / (4S)-4-hydroxy-2-oxoglutarate aldolase